MGNYTYLCTSNEPRIYPSISDRAYDPQRFTVAYDEGAIPLLWLMLFREEDIQEQLIEYVEPEQGRTPARTRVLRFSSPVVACDVATGRLARSMASFKKAFPAQHALKLHAEYLTQAITAVKRKFVSLELSELESAFGQDVFWPAFRACLRGFENPFFRTHAPSTSFFQKVLNFSPVKTEWEEALDRITSLRFASAFPPADIYHGDLNLRPNDSWNLARLLGASMHQPVPWENSMR